MVTFDSPQQATAYVVSRLLEQAARDAVTFDSFELRLLHGTASEDEIEEFEERNDEANAEEFWAKVNSLARRAVKLDPDLRQAMLRSEGSPSYLNDVLVVEGIARTRTARQQVRHFALVAVICVVGGLALAVGLVLLAPYFDPDSGKSKPVLSFLNRYGLAGILAGLVTALYWAVRKLRTHKV
jgi:hypothetical protein